MPMFGSGAPGAKLSLGDRARIFAVAMQDPSAGLRLKQQLGLQPLQNKFMNDLAGQLEPGYSEGPDVQVSVPPAGESATVPEFQMPQRTRDPININSPQLPGLAMQAQRLGVPITQLLDVLKAQQPDVAQGSDGSFYNKHDGGMVGRRLANRANVNNTVVDLNDPENTNRVIPSEPVKGAMPVYDNMGRVTDWSLPKGARGAIQGAAGAEAAGKAPFDFIKVDGPDGAPRVIAKSAAAGGDFAGQSPDDAAYAKSRAEAVATQYNGIQTAGANAGKQLATYARVKELLRGVDGGRLTPMGVELASAANSLGLKVDPKLGNKQAADAIINQIVLEANGGSLGPGVSNSDVLFLAKAGPNLMQSADGRQKVVDFAIAKARRSQQVAQMARQWQARAGRLDKPDRNGKTFFDYLDAYAEANPLMPVQ